MVTLEVCNRYVSISGAKSRLLSELDVISSYRVAGAHFTKSFREGYWDGRVRLLKMHSSTGQYRAPIGLLIDLARYFNNHDIPYIVKDSRRPLRSLVRYNWNCDISLRPYQWDAVERIMANPPIGAGIIKMPPGAGKTRTMAKIIHRLGVRTLFIVPAQLLLRQTQCELAEALQTDVGVIGDNEWIEKDLTVASIQTLVSRRGGTIVQGDKITKIPRTSEYRQLITAYDAVVFDECHHLTGERWHECMMDFDARFKMGLSATVFLNRKSECERGVIWLKACCSDICFEITTSKLIEMGYLMRPAVKLYPIHTPAMCGEAWDKMLINKLIYQNSHRNNKIVKIAKELVEQGLNVLIISNRLMQTQALRDKLEATGIPIATIVGITKTAIRNKRVAAFKTGRIKILIGTVFGEGVNIPEIEAVINAEGGKDIKAIYQRMRNLRLHDGKTEAIFVDFMDMTSKYTANHSAERLAVYRAEPAFRIQIMN